MIFCAAIFLGVASARGVEISETFWGFDNRVVPERINLLSVRLTNPSSSAFEGTLNLTRSYGFEGRVGALLEQEVFLSPDSSRWVQFFVYIQHANESIRLGWKRPGPDRKAVRLNPPTFSGPARVYLVDRDNVLSKRSRFIRFYEALMPTTVAAMEGLAEVLIDHQPDWEAVRRGAFIDWLRGGGVVHVLEEREGRMPEFREELAILNGEKKIQRVGRGRVVRHRMSAEEIGPEALETMGFPGPTFRENNQGQMRQMDKNIFTALKSRVLPRHNWPLIYALGGIYLFLIAPVNAFIGRKAGKVKASYIA
ncbi:MAG: hypothetical protein AAF492_18260, partial [Verrucomicrobiota bacterium]